MIRKRFDRLKTLDVKEPCPANWDEMTGDEAKRYCKHCQKSVHNLSAMTSEQAEELLNCGDGHLCVRYSSDRFGRLITLNGLIPRLAAATTFGAALVTSGCSVTKTDAAAKTHDGTAPNIERTETIGKVQSTPINQTNHTTGMVGMPGTTKDAKGKGSDFTRTTGQPISPKPKPNHGTETPTNVNQQEKIVIMGAVAPPKGPVTRTTLGRTASSPDVPKKR